MSHNCNKFPGCSCRGSITGLSSVLYLLLTLLCGSNPSFGIVFQSDSSSESSFIASDYKNNEVGVSSSELEATIPYYVDKDQYQKRYSEGGGVLLDNNENFGVDEYSDVSKQGKEEKVKWKGWNYLDTSEGWTPHEKTVSFQFLDDDGRYAHSPPSWPHDEYMVQFGHPYSPQNFGLRNGSESGGSLGSTNGLSESNKAYEWQKLHARPSPQGHFIGPGFYDYGSTQTFPHNPQYTVHTHQKITDSNAASVISSSSASSSSGGEFGDGQIPNAVSESATHYGKLFPGGYGNPYDYYRRKRLRLNIHPGLLAAPIAGFAAYKAINAIASKPLLFELGWVGNKPNIDVGGGWGWPQPRPPYPYYPPVAPIPNPYPQGLHPQFVSPGYGPIVPILTPKRKPDATRTSSWWNPFAALTPRFRNKKDDRSCCEDKQEQGTTTNVNTVNSRYHWQ